MEVGFLEDFCIRALKFSSQHFLIVAFVLHVRLTCVIRTSFALDPLCLGLFFINQDVGKVALLNCIGD